MYYADGYNGDQTYMEQEEEWEREGLLDPAWEKQQKKVSEKISDRVPYTPGLPKQCKHVDIEVQASSEWPRGVLHETSSSAVVGDK